MGKQCRLGKSLKKYRDGKLPKAFEYIPYMEYWEDVLLLTEPEHWSPNAMYEVTRIFVSQSDLGVFESFNRLVLLPYIRSDIRKNKRLHFVLHLALNKTLEIKPAAFFNGILFPLCDSRTCTLREAVLIGSTLRKVLISPPHPRYERNLECVMCWSLDRGCGVLPCFLLLELVCFFTFRVL